MYYRARISPFLAAQEVLVHLDRVDVPGHLGLGEGSQSSQVLEELVRHFLVYFVQLFLHLGLESLDD